jgi:hypothetical protein
MGRHWPERALVPQVRQAWLAQRTDRRWPGLEPEQVLPERQVQQAWLAQRRDRHWQEQA